jgi:DNA primase
MQKESCLEQLSQAFNLKPEAVKRDFLNRNQARERVNNRSNNNQNSTDKPITLNAELRGLIAVTADLAQYKKLRSSLAEEDFKNPDARRLFRLLEECFNNNTFSIPDILTACTDKQIQELITNVISSGMYQADNIDIVINDTIKYVKRNNLEEKRNNLVKRISEFIVVTEEDKTQLNNLLKEKMELDKQVQNYQK